MRRVIVRAGMETVQAEIEASGFELLTQKKERLKDNYFLVFAKK